MTHEDAYAILCEYQLWRRGEGKYAWSEVPEENKAFPYSQKLLGNALDVALDVLSKSARNDNSESAIVTGGK